MSKIKPRHDFGKDAKSLQNTAEQLRGDALNHRKEVSKLVGQASAEGKEAVARMGEAGASALEASKHVVDGTVDLMKAEGHLWASAGVELKASGFYISEKITEVAVLALNNLAHAAGNLSHELTTGKLKYGQTVTVQDIVVDTGEQRTSEILFGKAKEHLVQSEEVRAMAWFSYAMSVGAVIDSGENLGAAAKSVASMTKNLSHAALELGAAGVIDLAALAMEISVAATQGLEDGLDTTGELLLLAARLTASTHNFVNNPDQDEIKIATQKLKEEFAAEFKKLQR